MPEPQRAGDVVASISDPRWPLVAARALDAKKGADTVVLDVGELLGITDHFVISSASNDRLVRTLVDEVEKAVTEAGGPKPVQIEGRDDARWVLIDYGAFVVHVFLDEARHFYDLERLWNDAPRVDWHAA